MGDVPAPQSGTTKISIHAPHTRGTTNQLNLTPPAISGQKDEVIMQIKRQRIYIRIAMTKNGQYCIFDSRHKLPLWETLRLLGEDAPTKATAKMAGPIKTVLACYRKLLDRGIKGIPYTAELKDVIALENGAKLAKLRALEAYKAADADESAWEGVSHHVRESAIYTAFASDAVRQFGTTLHDANVRNGAFDGYDTTTAPAPIA